MRERCGGLIGSTLLILCAIAVGLGIFFRLHDLSKPVPFEDEAMTWLRVSGHSEAELNAFLYDGRFHTVAEIAAFQRHNADRDLPATIRVLARDDPQHAPLFYALERFWSGIAGDSLTAKRLPSALAGIALIAAFALLCRVLFQSNLAAMLGAALVALSPLHIAYAQQAREYELWALCVCLSSAALIAELPFAYFFAAVAALYASVLSLIVMAAQGIWLLAARGRRTLALGLSAGAALAAYAPWLANLAANRTSAFDANTWSATPWPLMKIVEKWAFNLSTTFFDVTYANARYALLGGAVLLFTLFAYAEILKRFPRRIGGYVVLLTLASAGAFLLPDLLFHEHRSTISRYVLPTFIGVELAVAGTLTVHLRERRGRTAWAAIFVALLGLGAWSATVRQTRASWWENNKDAQLPAIAGALNAHAQAPLIAEDGTTVLALSNLLDPRIRVKMVAANDRSWQAAAHPDAFVLTPSPALRTALERQGLRLVGMVGANRSTALSAFRASLKADDADAELTDTPSLWRIEAAAAKEHVKPIAGRRRSRARQG